MVHVDEVYSQDGSFWQWIGANGGAKAYVTVNGGNPLINSKTHYAFEDYHIAPST